MITNEIKAVVKGYIERKEWRDFCWDEVKSYTNNKYEQNEIRIYIETEYEKAGAGYAGRWQK